MLLEYIEGKSLFTVRVDDLRGEQEKHLYGQLSDLYLKLFQQQFDRIGAFTLDNDNEN